MNCCKKANKTNPQEPVIDNNTKNEKKTLKRTFYFALFLGITLVLVSIIINNNLNDIPDPDKLNPELLFWIDIFVELLKSIGIAIIIAFIFSFVSSTQAFIDFIRERLISIIITKDFLSKMSNDELRDTIKKILKFSEKPAYAGIDDYFNKHITHSFSLFKTHFRSAYQLNAIAKFDKVRNVVCVDSVLRYRIYKVAGSFEDYNIGFEEDDAEVQPVEVDTPNKKFEIPIKLKSRVKMAEEGIKSIFKNDESLTKESYAELDSETKNELDKYDHLDVVNRYTEFGNDHWHLFSLRMLKPCDKLTINLSCDSGLVIKKYVPFGELNSFYSNLLEENRVINIYCNEWVEAGLGVALLIAKKEELKNN